MVELQSRIKDYMSEYRYLHTLSVAKECKKLASIFNIDEAKLVASAYLHDITKDMSIDEQLKLCQSFGIQLDKATLNSPKTIHSFTAPLLIQKDFSEYADECILNAVRYHTTGRADMTIYEKLLYIADYIEPTRKFEDCIKLREFFYKDNKDIQKRLDQTILLSLKYTISDLLESNSAIHPETLNAYNYLLLKSGD